MDKNVLQTLQDKILATRARIVKLEADNHRYPLRSTEDKITELKGYLKGLLDAADEIQGAAVPGFF